MSEDAVGCACPMKQPDRVPAPYFLNCICPSCTVKVLVTRNDAVLNPGINQQETLSQRVHKMLSRLMRSSSGLTWKDQWVELWP